MHVSSLSGIYSNFIQPILSKTLGVGSAPGAASAASSVPQDSSQLSPFGLISSTLQQLQQQSPAQFQSVTKQIAASLQTASQSAKNSGNTTLATQLTQLSGDFTNASQNNQLPNFQDLAQAISGGHQQHRSAQLNQFTASSAQNQSLNPGSVILNTLSSSGISLS